MRTRTAILRMVLRGLLGSLFLVGGFLKVGDPAAFGEAIMGYRIVGREIAVPLAHYLPWLEMVCGLVLWTGWPRLYRGALWVAAGMISVFLTALGFAIGRGLKIDCGCFGPGVGNDPRTEIWIVVAMALALVSLIRCGGPPPVESEKSLEPQRG